MTDQEIIKQEIKDNDIVFDIGFYTGEWVKEVYKHCDCKVYGFEALKNIKFPAEFLKKDFTLFDDIIISDINGSMLFYVYLDNPQNSTIYEKTSDEMPNKFKKQSLTLDYICRKHNINHIDFLHIDTNGSELDVLKGCKELISQGKIKKIQFNNYYCERIT